MRLGDTHIDRERNTETHTRTELSVLVGKGKDNYLGYSECTPTSAIPASSVHAADTDSRFPAHGVFIDPGIDSVETGFRSCRIRDEMVRKRKRERENVVY